MLARDQIKPRQKPRDIHRKWSTCKVQGGEDFGIKDTMTPEKLPGGYSHRSTESSQSVRFLLNSRLVVLENEEHETSILYFQ